MHDASLFVPETLLEALRDDLATGLRAVADALDARQLDGRFNGGMAAAGGRCDDRMHLRIVLDLAAPILRPIEPHAASLKITNQS